jgi:hypothetical protein
MSGFYRGPGGTGDATGDAVNEASIAIIAAESASASAVGAATSASDASVSADEAAASALAAAASATASANSATDAANSAAGIVATALLKANNLSDLASVSTARTNLGLVASATTDTTNATNISSGTLNSGRLPTSGVTANTYGSGSTIPVVTIDATGRVTSATTASVQGGQYFGAAATKAIAYNSTSIAENITTTAGNNCLSVGPISVATGYTVTVATGQRWVIL